MGMEVVAEQPTMGHKRRGRALSHSATRACADLGHACVTHAQRWALSAYSARNSLSSFPIASHDFLPQLSYMGHVPSRRRCR